MEVLGLSLEPATDDRKSGQLLGQTGHPKEGTYSELAVVVILEEYAALRAEVVDLARRASQLVQLMVAATGALLAAGFLTQMQDTSQKPATTFLLLGSAGLGWLVAIVYLGHVNKQLEIGHYIRHQAVVLRDLLERIEATTPQSPTSSRTRPWVLGWEDRIASSPFTRDDTTILVADVMQGGEIALLAAIPLLFFLLGVYFLATSDLGSSSVPTLIVLAADFVILALLLTSGLLTVYAHRWRDRQYQRRFPTV